MAFYAYVGTRGRRYSLHHTKLWIKYDVGSSYPGAEEGPKGLAVRKLKGYASLVQNVARQFGLHLLWAWKFERVCP